MRTSKSVFGIGQYALFAICSVAFVLIGKMLFRDYGDGSWFCRTSLFWFRLAWFELIFVLFWSSLFGIPLRLMLEFRMMTGATYAIMASVMLRCAIISFFIWCGGVLVPVDTHWVVIPIAVQLLVVMYYGVILYMFPRTQQFQRDEMDCLPINVPPPSELSNRLKNLERNESDAIVTIPDVKRLRERILYSLPSVGKISVCKEYQILVQKVNAFCSGPKREIAAIDEMERLVDKVQEFCKK